MSFDGLLRITGTCGMEAAALAQIRANDELVPLYYCNQETTHRSRIFFQSPSRLSRSCALCAVRAPLRAPTTRSRPGRSGATLRKESRTTRFTRLRATELPTALAPI